VAASAAQRACKQVGTIAEMQSRALDAAFGSFGNVACQRRAVQDDGNGGGRKSAALGDVADSDCGCLRMAAWGLDARLDFSGETFRVGFESADSMSSLNSGLLLADTTGR